MKRVLILVEGQTEERFVKDVLSEYLLSLSVSIQSTILTTKRVPDGPNFKGGVVSFAKFESDLRRLLKGAGSDGLVTMMLDYYRLPDDVPGMSDRPTPVADKFSARVEHVELALTRHFDHPRFLPFLALHEFEAWVLSCPSTLPAVMAQPEKQGQFAAICGDAITPELLNEKPGRNPAALIASIFPGYAKNIHGPTATKRIGLPLIRGKCPHFDHWLRRIEGFGHHSAATASSHHPS